MLRDVNWEDLADQLDLDDRVTSIDVACTNERRAIRAMCYLREVVKKYIQSQPSESCDLTVGKIAKALDELGYINEASQLIRISELSCMYS